MGKRTKTGNRRVQHSEVLSIPIFGKGSWAAPIENTSRSRTLTCLSVVHILTQNPSKEMASNIVTTKAEKDSKRKFASPISLCKCECNQDFLGTQICFTHRNHLAQQECSHTATSSAAQPEATEKSAAKPVLQLSQQESKIFYFNQLKTWFANRCPRSYYIFTSY